MRYLIVCDYSLTFLGGAQIALMRQAEALAANDAAVAVLAPDSSKVSFSANITVLEPPKTRAMPGIQLPLFRNNEALRGFAAQTLEDFKPDAILSHSEFGLVAAVTAEAHKRRVPSLHTVHTFFWHAPKPAAVLAPLARAIFKTATNLPYPKAKLASNPMDSTLRNMTLAACLHADVTISPSKHQGEKISAAGVTHVEVVSNVTETLGKPSAPPSGEVLKLAWIGRFSPEKRLEVALEAVELAKARGAKVELHIAGGAPREGDGNIWHGTLTSAEVSELLTASDAAMLTSLGFDNQPMVVLEAFAHGRPVLVSDPVLGKEFGSAAALSPESDAAGMAEVVVYLASDRNLLRQMSEAATKAATLSTAKVHAETLARITSEATNRIRA